MKKKSFSIILAVLIFLIFILDMLAAQYFLYWRFWWLDIIMHFLGGFWLALAFYYLFYFSGYLGKVGKKFSVFTLSLTTVVSVGVLWEVFEYLTKVSVRQPNYTLDTSLDLLMDVIGWLVAYFFLLKFHQKKLMIAEKEENDKM